MLEWMLANPGWTALLAVVIVLAAFGVLMIWLLVFDWGEVDEKSRQAAELRREQMRQIYEDPNRFEAMRKHVGDPNGWHDKK